MNNPTPGFDAEEAARRHRSMTLGNWSDAGPAMDYVFLRMSEFFRHAVIHRNGAISELPCALSDEVSGFQIDSNLGSMPLDDYVGSAPVNGTLITYQGRIVYERYPRMRAYDKHLLMSVSKIFASTVIAILADRGKLNVEHPVDNYLPELADSGWSGVSIHDILDMASGIACLESDEENAYADPETPYYQYEASLDWLKKTSAAHKSTYEYIATLDQHREPGAAFEYTSANTFVLSWLTERITGKPYNEILTDEIWSKIGAESDALIATSSINAQASHGGISATLRDIARLGMLFTPSWHVITEEPIISAAYMDNIQNGGRPAIFDKASSGKNAIERLRGERPKHNSYQWDWVMDDGDFYKGGYGGQGLYISPTRDLTIAFTGTPAHDGATNEMSYVARQLAKSKLFG